MTQDEKKEIVVEGRQIDEFKILEKWSGGAFSVVHIANHIPSKSYCVAKVINISKQSPDGVACSLKELSIFMQVSHPNIEKLYRFSFEYPLLIFFFEYLPNGTLRQYVAKKRGLDENEARKMFIQIFAALRYIHLHHFLVHRDIKLENLMLDKDNNVKLIDFGLSTTFYNNIVKGVVGTPGYMPPEVMTGSEYNEKCDVWSLGVSLFYMLTSFLPFTVQSHNIKLLLAEREKFLPPRFVSPQCADILMKMLNPKPDYRPSLIDLQKHPWLIGLPPITRAVIPNPIKLYSVKNYSAINKFKRNSVEADPAILEQVVEKFKIDKDKLIQDLKDGIVNNITTDYFIFNNPITEKPQPVVEKKTTIIRPQSDKSSHEENSTPRHTLTNSKSSKAFAQNLSSTNHKLTKVGNASSTRITHVSKDLTPKGKIQTPKVAKRRETLQPVRRNDYLKF